MKKENINQKKQSKNRLSTLKKFLIYYKPVLGVFLIDTFFAVLSAAALVAWPIVTQEIVNTAIEAQVALQDGTSSSQAFILLYGLIGAFISLVIVRLISTAYVTYWGHLMGVKMEIQMRKEMIEKLHRLPMERFDKMDAGSFISRIVTDIKDIPEFAHHAPEDLIIGTITLIGGLAYTFATSWILGIALLVIFIPGVYVSFKQHSKIWTIWEKIKAKNSTISDVVGKQVDSITEIKSYSAIDLEQERVAKYQKTYQKAWRKFYRNETIFTLTNTAIVMLFVTSAITIGSIQIANNEISFGQFTGLIAASSFMSMPVQKFAILYISTAQGFSSVTRFFDFHTWKEEKNEGTLEAPNFKGLIEFKNVNFSYVDEKERRITVFENLNIKFERGKTIALVGETGIGKSTLVKLILRYYPIDSGEILIDGKSIYDFEINDYRKKLTYVQQDPIIFDDTISNNIRYSNVGMTDQEIQEVAKLAQLDNHIEGLKDKYETMAGTKGAKLSGGQKQRLALARAFAVRAPILIMDEPTSSLDNATEKKIKEVVNKLTKDKTSIIIAHRLTTIKEADQVIVLGKKGKVLEQGTHQELIDKKDYYYTLNNI